MNNLSTTQKRGAFARVVTGVLFSMSLFVAAQSVNAAGRVFYDDFESGNTNKWVADEYHNKCSIVSSAVDGISGHRGAKMAECNWDGVVAWNDPKSYSGLRLNSWSYDREFLIRFRVRYATDVDHKVNGKLFRLDPNDFKDSFYFAAQMEQAPCASPFVYWEWINGSNGPKLWGGSQCLGDGKWHEIEIYVKLNSSGASDGAIKVWQDGKLEQSATNIVSHYGSNRWFPLYVMSNWSSNGPDSAHDANNHVYWDEFEIYSDSGSGASGLLSDGTVSAGSQAVAAPMPPQGLMVVE